MAPRKQTDKVKKFLQEIAGISEYYGLSLSHEDPQGSFIVEDFNQKNIDWLLAASDEVAKGTTDGS